MAKFVVLNLAFLLMWISPAFAVDINENWISGNEEITPAHIEKMIAVFHEDEKSLDIIQTLANKMKVKKIEEVFQIVKVGTDFAGDEGARTTPGRKTRRYYYSDETLNRDLAEIRSEYFVYKISEFTNHKSLTAIALPTVYIRKDKPIFKIYIDLVHEFTHAIGFLEVPKYESIFDYANINDFVIRKLKSKNNEFDAYSAHISTWIRFKKKYNIDITYVIEQYFNDSGELIDPSGLENYILDEAIPSFSYRKFFELSYRVLASNNHLDLDSKLFAIKMTRSKLERNNESTATIDKNISDLEKEFDAVTVVYKKFYP